MAVTIRGTATNATNTNGSSQAITKPTGVVQNDIILLQAGWGPTGTTITPPTGFNLLQSSVFSDNSWTQNIYYKNAGGSEGASYTPTWSGNTYIDLGMIAYSGWDTASTPLSSTNTGTGTTSTGTGLTFTVDGSILVHFAVSSVGTRTSGPSGMNSQSNYDGNVYIDDLPVNTGASGDKTSVYSSQIWAVAMVGIQPAAAASVSDIVANIAIDRIVRYSPLLIR